MLVTEMWTGANIPSSGHVDVNVRYIVPEVQSISITSSGGIKISWEALPGANSYTLYRRDNTTNKETVVKSGLTNTNYTDSSYPEGKDLYYYVTASTSQGTISGAYNGKPVLSAPELASVKSTSSGITVSWEQVPNAQGYRIYRKDESGSWVGLGNVSSSKNSYTDTTADPEKSYTYTVRAYKGDGVKYYSTYDTTGITSLTQPVYTLSNTEEGIQIDWDKVTGATKYRVYYRSGTTGDWTRLTETTGTSYTYKGAKAGSTYYYTVRAFLDDDTYSAYRQDLAMKRLTQPEFTVSNTATGVQIDWSSVTGANKYRVYYRTEDMSGWTRLTETTDTSYIDTTAKSGVTYYYTVKALSDNTYWSSYREDVKIKRLAQPNFTLSNYTAGIKVSWDTVTGATKYRVYRRTNTTESWTTLTETTSTSYTDQTAKAGQTYYYTVKAFSGSEYSSYKLDETIKRLTRPEFTLSNYTAGVKVSWDTVTGATKYRVYRRTNTTESWTKLTETTSTSYTDQTAKAGQTYYYTVKAFSGSEYSSYKLGETIKRLTRPEFTLSNSGTGVQVNWEKVAGAEKYRVYRKTSATGSWTQLTETTGTSYTDTTAKAGTMYYYTVRAFSGNTYSSYQTDQTILYEK